MPIYTFYNENTKEYKDIVMSMNDKHEYIDESGYKWLRIFYAPQSSFDTKIDPFDSKDFVEKTGKKTGTMKDIWDASAELGEKRKEKVGRDFVKEKYYETYAKKTKGKPHIDKIREKAKEKLDKLGVSVE